MRVTFNTGQERFAHIQGAHLVAAGESPQDVRIELCILPFKKKFW
jgi:hypothetical protein